MPAKPEVSSEAGRLFTTYTAKCEQGGVAYWVIYFDPPAAAIAPAVVEATLKRDRDMGVKDKDGTLKSEEKITIKKDGRDCPGLASVIENSERRYHGRQYAVGTRVYALQVEHRRNEDHAADIQKFFDSFKTTDSAAPG
jgi:hypothetical protein